MIVDHASNFSRPLTCHKANEADIYRGLYSLHLLDSPCQSNAPNECTYRHTVQSRFNSKDYAGGHE
ncbi:hypothetical protein EAE96_005358 [Botrytis aclada]|nr:hypothetical protein EAE96_005358 [Botrytis aclada]